MAPAALVYTMTEGLLVQSTMQTTGLALLEVEKKVLKPVFAGDTIYAESEILDKRESQSRPTQGIVTIKTTGLNQDGVVFMTFTRAMLMPKRGHATEDKAPAY